MTLFRGSGGGRGIQGQDWVTASAIPVLEAPREGQPSQRGKSVKPHCLGWGVGRHMISLQDRKC